MKILIVGTGLFGAVCARELAIKGHDIDIIDKRDHIAGNVYTENIDGINVHRYGAHIFHTVNKDVWNYIQQFAEFNRYTNEVIANYHGELYNLPFNMNTFNKMWGVVKPEEAKQIIDEQRAVLGEKQPENLEEQAISLIGTDIYEKLVKEYTAKQWGRDPKELPSFIIRRLPVRFTFDNNYFNDPYQGIPIGGYTQIVERMLCSPHISTHLNTDFFDYSDSEKNSYDKIIFTGMIDQFFGYKFGELQYRSLRFETEELEMSNYQGNAVMNYTDADTPFTRIIEHKFFEFGNGNKGKTIITREYPQEWTRGVFGGRLGMYRYYNMDQVISAALELVRNTELFNN